MGRPRVDPTEYQIEKIVGHRVTGKTYWSRWGGLDARDLLLGKVSPAKAKKREPGARCTRSSADPDYAHLSLPVRKLRGRKKRGVSVSVPEKTPEPVTEPVTVERVESPKTLVEPMELLEIPEAGVPREDREAAYEEQSRSLSVLTPLDETDEEDANEEYEEVVDGLEYRGDWDWPKDVLRLLKIQRSSNGQLEALVRWKDGQVAAYRTSYIKERHPYLLIKYYEDRILFQ